MSIDIATLRPKLEAALGDQLQLGALLGQGGFAAVFRAHDPFLERDVAIKVLDPSLAVDAALEEQFLHEARDDCRGRASTHRAAVLRELERGTAVPRHATPPRPVA
jgi:serine/threonine protein kinase